MPGHGGQAYFSSLPGVDIHHRYRRYQICTSQASYSPEYITPTLATQKNHYPKFILEIFKK
jgi:hypothetical protein